MLFEQVLDIVSGEDVAFLHDTLTRVTAPDQYVEIVASCRCSEGHPGRPEGVTTGCGINACRRDRQPRRMTAPPKYRKPATAPTAAQVADAERWAKLADSSLATTQAAAEKWRTGLAAFVTIVTGGLLIKGPEAAADIERSWLVALTLLAAAGLDAPSLASGPHCRRPPGLRPSRT